jgi:signal transduction histidine kinase
VNQNYFKKEILLSSLIYFLTIFILFMAVYRFLETGHLSTFNFFVAGSLVVLVAIGWGYIIAKLLIAPRKQRDDTLLMLTQDIIHELNIPLSTIRANSALLSRNETNAKSLQRISRIDDASLRLEKLYNELIYTIKKEIQEVEKERFDLKELLEERIEILSAQKRHIFKINVDSFPIEADKIGFEQMLDNILTNAMKYSKKESLIFISLNDDTLCIEDQGVGMSTSELLRVYERYFQSDEVNAGQGIGLGLVKKYCDVANIKIHIDSEKERGTTVCINLIKVKSLTAI